MHKDDLKMSDEGVGLYHLLTTCPKGEVVKYSFWQYSFFDDEVLEGIKYKLSQKE